VLRRGLRSTRRCRTPNQIRSLTPSTTWAVVDLRVSQVLSPACRTVSRLPFAAFTTLDFVPLLDAAFRADRFLVDRFLVDRFLAEERFAELRFLPDRLVDFLVAAIWSLDRRLTGIQSHPAGWKPKTRG
jgi:hypothetical protein